MRRPINHFRFVQAWVDGEGRVHRYFPRPGYPRVRLPGLPGSPEFNRAYEAALETPQVPIGSKRTKPGTASAAIAGYYTSLEFRSLAPGTQAMRRAILERFRAAHGDKPIALMPQKFIAHVLSDMKPFAARNWLKTICGRCNSAWRRKCARPTRRKGSDCREQKLMAFILGPNLKSRSSRARIRSARWRGSRSRIGVYTGLRRGDAVGIGPQHVRDGVLAVRQEKTGGALRIPLHTDMLAILDATPSGNMAFLVTSFGKPFSDAWFRRMVSEAM